MGEGTVYAAITGYTYKNYKNLIAILIKGKIMTKHFYKYPLLALLTAVITTGCSNKLYECNSDQAKQKLENEVQTILINLKETKLRMHFKDAIQSFSGKDDRKCVANVEWFYKTNGRELPIEKGTLVFNIFKNPLNKDQIMLFPELTLIIVSDLVEKGEALED